MPTFKPTKKDQGWLPFEKRSYGVNKTVSKIMQDMPLMTAEGHLIRGTGAGVTMRLDRVLKEVAGEYAIVRQLIGDCVSFGWRRGIATTYAADIAVRNEAEKWFADICTEWIYGTSRVLVGKGQLGNEDGSVGSWAAQAVLDHGILFRTQYKPSSTTYDLSSYDPKRAKSWGYRGLPYKDLEPTADEHPVSRKCALVTTYEEARDAIANGYAVPVCSNRGFKDVRDKDGFLLPSGTWYHCMCFMATNEEDRPDRPGLGLDNSSWGAWCSGPNPDDLPDGCGWVDAEVCDKMLRQQDSYAVPGVDGFVKQVDKISWKPW